MYYFRMLVASIYLPMNRLQTSAVRIDQPGLYTHPEIDHKPKLFDQFRHKIRLKHQSIRTEQAYINGIKRFILYHDKGCSISAQTPEVEAFPTDLAVERQVSAFTQRHAVYEVAVPYRWILERALGWIEDMEWAKQIERLPKVRSRMASARPALFLICKACHPSRRGHGC